ncbi:DUF779 domain-containing protein [Methylotenera sp.]|uniref:DUF779 domain-containing protein n=1 Tax=Methylotenera sp. TaxID=2051956 RepID=UPI002719912D|nr:DUF779 domain-containing protein [Methylotenera sp.]MDO9204528.1 DUF779 domain-containing protein [Methylotenera sp.]MDO9394010.1 DUF779 domain-containing protein [Methylotenera sp.]MDP1523216.1 DUF779 domain-containing protein [Methylotenera sp.]MDP2071434.1 DUF779 domain-containing protein [Methylotenera sp.]MDP2230406.1 DUF779 domain-containing protein [Methylotenera sp.]
MAERVSATPAAIELIHKLTAQHGPILFLQSGGCCEGSVPLCMPANEFKPGASDVIVGEIEGAVFYMGHNHFQFSENTHTILDAMPGSSGSFSLDCGTGMAFITRGRLFTDDELKSLPPVITYGLN